MKFQFTDDEWKQNQTIILKHLENTSNKKLHIPVVSLKKIFSYEEIYKEVTDLSDIGKTFIGEMMENIEEFKNM